MTVFFDDFPKISDHFPKIFQHYSEGQRNIPEDCRRLNNEFKINLRDKLDINEIIDIFTSQDMENTPRDSRCSFV